MTYKLQKKIHSALAKIKAASLNLYYQKNMGLELEFDLTWQGYRRGCWCDNKGAAVVSCLILPTQTVWRPITQLCVENARPIVAGELVRSAGHCHTQKVSEQLWMEIHSYLRKL